MVFDLQRQLKPALAIVGRPNVGKSTLFNRITRSREALVANVPGVTRDPKVGVGRIGESGYLVVDTGGIDYGEGELSARVTRQAELAIAECDAVLFLVDGRDGLTADDEALALSLRKLGKPIHVAVNKVDNADDTTTAPEFARLGLGPMHAISATHGIGVDALIAIITAPWPVVETDPSPEAGVRVAIVGRPNVGKSTLVNRMLGEERMITGDVPGTTHDSVAIPFERHGRRYTLIDTAGLRRRSRIDDVVEKFSAIKSLQAIDLANVVICVFDAHEAITEQDISVLGSVLECGRSLVLAINKWDGLETGAREAIKRQIDRRLAFVDFAEVKFISALHGTAVGDLFGAIDAAWKSANIEASTNTLSELLAKAVAGHAPPLAHGRRIKLRYAHFGAKNPPTIIIHGNQTDAVPEGYRRYLSSFFRRALKLTGTPVRIEFRSGENPFAGKRNPLTQRQVAKRQRLIRHVKKRN